MGKKDNVSAAVSVGRSAAASLGRSAAVSVGRSAAVSVSAITSLQNVRHVVSAITRVGASAVVRLRGNPDFVRSAIANLSADYRSHVSAAITLRGDREIE